MALDANFSISTEGLTEKGKDIVKENQIIKDALEDIETANASLDGWVSANKQRYADKMKKVMPMMYEMTDVIDSYGGVAVQTSEKAIAVENKIAAAIDDDIAA